MVERVRFGEGDLLQGATFPLVPEGLDSAHSLGAPAMQVIQDRAQTAGCELSLGSGRQWVNRWQRVHGVGAHGGGRKKEAFGNPGWGAGVGGGFPGSDGGGKGPIHAASPKEKGNCALGHLVLFQAGDIKQR